MTRLVELLALLFAVVAWWWALTEMYRVFHPLLNPLRMVLP